MSNKWVVNFIYETAAELRLQTGHWPSRVYLGATMWRWLTDELGLLEDANRVVSVSVHNLEVCYQSGDNGLFISFD